MGLTAKDGKLVLRDGALGTEAACCCGGGCCCVDGQPDTLKTTQAACEEAGGTWLPAGEFLHCGGECPEFSHCVELYPMTLLDPNDPPGVAVTELTEALIDQHYGAVPPPYFYNVFYTAYGDLYPGVLFLYSEVTGVAGCDECLAAQSFYDGRPLRICETISVPCPNPCPNPFP